MKRLIHVVRGSDRGWVFNFDRHERLPSRTEPVAILTNEVDTDREQVHKVGEFFYAQEQDVEMMVNLLAQYNPGLEVRVYNLESSAQTTVGPVVHKRVSKSGVLPADGAAANPAELVEAQLIQANNGVGGWPPEPIPFFEPEGGVR